ncbi:MAG: hypothetical protein ACLSE8_03025 [Parasutterella sp.]
MKSARFQQVLEEKLSSSISRIYGWTFSVCFHPRRAAISAAKDSINKNNYVLSGQEAGELFSVIDKGFVPNERLKEAMRLAEQIENNVASHGF